MSINEIYHETIQWDPIAHSKWITDDGDHTHLINWPLKKNSMVLDIGCYTGDWIRRICSTYNCFGIGLEPVTQYFEKNLNTNCPNVKYSNIGLTTEESKKYKFYINGDRTTIETNDKKSEEVQLINAKEFFDTFTEPFDLVQINIEGFEYKLLPYMINCGIMDKINSMQVQFHNVSNLSAIKKEEIDWNLKQLGYKVKFDYNFVWYGVTKL